MKEPKYVIIARDINQSSKSYLIRYSQGCAIRHVCIVNLCDWWFCDWCGELWYTYDSAEEAGDDMVKIMKERLPFDYFVTTVDHVKELKSEITN